MRRVISFVAAGIVLSVAFQTLTIQAATTAPNPANTIPDAAALLSNYDNLALIDQQIAGDRTAMHKALTSNGNSLFDAVITFFHDRDSAATIDLNFIATRLRLRRDIGYVPAPLTRPLRAQGLIADAARYISDFNTRSAAFNAVAADLSSMRMAVAKSDLTAVTSDANAFFLDRHMLVQSHINEGGDIGALRKDLRFRGSGKVSRPQRTGLEDHVRTYLADREAWLDIGAKVAADREAISDALNKNNLDKVVQQFLVDHHKLFILEKQLTADRDAMRRDVGFKQARHAQNFFGSLVGIKNAKDEKIANEDIDQDVSIDNVGDR